MKVHRLAASDFDELAVGRAGAELIHRLKATQLSKRMLALRAVMDDAARLVPDAFARSGMTHSFGVLAAAHRKATAEMQELLLSPGIGIWAMHCLRRMRGTVTAPTPIEEELAGLSALAAAAALRAGLDAEVTVLLKDNELVLPTLGRFRGDVSGWVRARIVDRVLSLPVSGAADEHEQYAAAATVGRREVPSWQAIAALGSEIDGSRIEVFLDFLDPARMLLELPMSPDVDADVMELWQQRLDDGWRILRRYDPPGAQAIASGITTIFPLHATSSATELSASAGEAFGAVAMTLPKDGLSFAAALVHEFQHNKLSALLDLVTLFEPTEGRLFYAPWRTDPRPLPGLMQGAYAYLGLTGFWDFQRSNQEAANYAHFEFARWREEVWRVLVAVRLSGAMTPLGLRFLDGMRNAVWNHRQASVPAEPRQLARQIRADTWVTWRLRNLEPAAEQVAAFALRWAGGRPAPTGPRLHTHVRPGVRGLVHNARLDLAYLRLNEPKLFRAAREGVPGVLEGTGSVADRAYAVGALAEATAAYKEEIARDPDRLDAWAGLVLCRRETDAAGSRTLITRPELVRAVHRGVEDLTGERVDPDVLAAWLPAPTADGGVLRTDL